MAIAVAQSLAVPAGFFALCHCVCVCVCVAGHLPAVHHEEAVPAAGSGHGAARGHRLHRRPVPLRVRPCRVRAEGSLPADLWGTAAQPKH